METIVYQVEFNDGRIFRIFCANATQKRRVAETYKKIEDKCKQITVITNGLHTAKEWETIVETI